MVVCLALLGQAARQRHDRKQHIVLSHYEVMHHRRIRRIENLTRGQFTLRRHQKRHPFRHRPTRAVAEKQHLTRFWINLWVSCHRSFIGHRNPKHLSTPTNPDRTRMACPSSMYKRPPCQTMFVFARPSVSMPTTLIASIGLKAENKARPAARSNSNLVRAQRFL